MDKNQFEKVVSGKLAAGWEEWKTKMATIQDVPKP